MKKSFSVFIMLGIILLGAYYVVGIVTEHALKKNLSMLDQSHELSLSIQEYHRHWFDSTATLRWRIHAPSFAATGQHDEAMHATEQDYDVIVPIAIHHGPIIIADRHVRFALAAANTRLLIPEMLQAKLANSYTVTPLKPTLDLHILMTYFKQMQLHIDLPAFQMTAKQGQQSFVWQGLANDIELSSNFYHMNGKLALAGMKLSKDDVVLSVQQLMTDYMLHQTDIGLFLGKADLSLSAIEMSRAQTKLLALTHLAAHSFTDLQEGMLQTDIDVKFDKIFADDQTYGPGLLQLSLKHMDAQVLLAINQQFNNMQQGNELQQQQALLKMIPDIIKLFTSGAQLSLKKLSVILPEGKLDMSLNVSMIKGAVNNPIELIQKLQGNAKIELPAVVVQHLLQELATQALIKRSSLQDAVMQQMVQDRSQDKELAAQAALLADQKVKSMIQAGALVVQNDGFLIDLQLSNGVLMVNGKPFTAAMAPVI